MAGKRFAADQIIMKLREAELGLGPRESHPGSRTAPDEGLADAVADRILPEIWSLLPSIRSDH